MEPATHDDIWSNYLWVRPMLNYKARKYSASSDWPGMARPDPVELRTNLAYAVVMCRLHYYRKNFSIPHEHDISALASIWKRYYNTELGAGTREKFIAIAQDDFAAGERLA